MNETVEGNASVTYTVPDYDNGTRWSYDIGEVRRAMFGLWSNTPVPPKVEPAWLIELKASLIERPWEWGRVLMTDTYGAGKVFTMESAAGVRLTWDVKGQRILFNGLHATKELDDTLKHHLAIKTRERRKHDFGDTATQLAKAVLAGELDAARGIADEIIAHHSGGQT